MTGTNKLFIHLEPLVLENIDKMEPRDLGHIMYAYSIRNIGNPELYKAFEKRIEEYIDNQGNENEPNMDHFDFPFLSNLIYYMMFRTNTNSKIWKNIIEATLNQDDILPMNCYKPFKYSKFYL